MSDEPEPWSVRRWKELERLDRLLIECETIDRGNNILSRMKRIIAEAKKLRDRRSGGEHQGFVDFLREQARAGYAKRKRKTKEAS
jgi:hypothetical protein